MPTHAAAIRKLDEKNVLKYTGKTIFALTDNLYIFISNNSEWGVGEKVEEYGELQEKNDTER